MGRSGEGGAAWLTSKIFIYGHLLLIQSVNIGRKLVWVRYSHGPPAEARVEIRFIRPVIAVSSTGLKLGFDHLFDLGNSSLFGLLFDNVAG